MKNFLILFLFAIIGFSACKNEPKTTEKTYTTFEGKTMGTYYRVTYADSLQRNFRNDFEKLLKEINDEVSTYIPTSTISQFNQSEEGLNLSGKIHFLANLTGATEINQKSGGAFDPTVMPLVNYWGFGYTEKKPVTEVDSLKIDSMMQSVGLQHLQLIQGDSVVLKKNKSSVQLDFSGIATGYALDTMGKFLERQGIQDYLVDIGGEQRARGLSPRGEVWNIGINVPKETADRTDVQVTFPLKDWSVSTSGNYRNFYVVNGVKYSHTINPKTGYPERNTLLSASVFSKNAIAADAWATAFMVMGLDRASRLADELPEIEAYFIYGKEDGSMAVKYSTGLKEIFDKK